MRPPCCGVCVMRTSPSLQFLRATAQPRCGFSFVELLVVIAVTTLIFGALAATLQLLLETTGYAKAAAGARSLAIARLEAIRALPYDDIATIGGIPAGSLPQTSTTTLNGVTYEERLLVQYIDRPADGVGVNDANGITADSKVVKVTYRWNVRGRTDQVAFTTHVAPPGLETVAGGGTLVINVFDATVSPVAGAEVSVRNDTGTSTIDVTVTSNDEGRAVFPGAPALPGYEVTVTKPGYSTDQTYVASSTNPNPDPPPAAVIAGQVSTLNFSIDTLGELRVRTLEPPAQGLFRDTFSNMASVATSSDVTAAGEGLRVAAVGSGYEEAGIAIATTTAPAPLERWEQAAWQASSTASSTYAIQLYEVEAHGTTTEYTLLPDTVLPGNSTGFTESPLDLSQVNVANYPALALGVRFQHTGGEPAVLGEWSLSHVSAQQPIAGVTLSVRGEKTIGTNGGAPVYKFTETVTTDSGGEAVTTAREWDRYHVAIDDNAEGYDIQSVTPLVPYALDPGESATLTLELVPDAPHSLRVSVVDSGGEPLHGAQVTLSRIGFEETMETPAHGQVFFGDMTNADDYTLTVSRPGYDTYVEDEVVVANAASLRIPLTAE